MEEYERVEDVLQRGAPFDGGACRLVLGESVSQGEVPGGSPEQLVEGAFSGGSYVPVAVVGEPVQTTSEEDVPRVVSGGRSLAM